MEGNFGETCRKWVIARYAAGRFEHDDGCNISVFIGTFLSTPSLQIEKKPHSIGLSGNQRSLDWQEQLDA